MPVKSLTGICLSLLLLVGCREAALSLPHAAFSTESGDDVPVVGPHAVMRDAYEDSASDVSFSQRMMQIGADLPEVWLLAVEERTRLPQWGIARMEWRNAEEEYQTCTAELFEMDDLTVLHLVYSQKMNEYHIFRDGEYLGAVEFGEAPELAEPTGNTSLSGRMAEIGIDLPEAYLAEVERHTQFSPESFRFRNYTVELFEIETLTVLRLARPTGSYSQLNEYHVFQDDTYLGAVEFGVPTRSKERFERYGDRVWMIVDVYDGHGMGARAFHRTRQVWFEISDPGLGAALSFVTEHAAHVDYPGINTEYTAEVTDVGVLQDDDGQEYFELTVQWDEKISTRKGEDIPLLSEQGVVQYRYNEAGNAFHHSGGGMKIGGNVFMGGEQADTAILTLEAYNDGGMLYGRDRSSLLHAYTGGLQEITRSGAAEQQLWLRDYLDGYDDMEGIAALYQWREAGAG